MKKTTIFLNIIFLFTFTNCKLKSEKMNLIGDWVGSYKDSKVTLSFKNESQCSIEYCCALPTFDYHYKLKNDTLILNNEPFGIFKYSKETLRIDPIIEEKDLELIYTVDLIKKSSSSDLSPQR